MVMRGSKQMKTPEEPELRPDSELQDLILRELHIRVEHHHHWLVRSEMFNPPIATHNIWRIGLRLKKQGLLNSAPGDDANGWWMSISTEGVLYCEKKGL